MKPQSGRPQTEVVLVWTILYVQMPSVESGTPKFAKWSATGDGEVPRSRLDLIWSPVWRSNRVENKNWCWLRVENKNFPKDHDQHLPAHLTTRNARKAWPYGTHILSRASGTRFGFEIGRCIFLNHASCLSMHGTYCKSKKITTHFLYKSLTYRLQNRKFQETWTNKRHAETLANKSNKCYLAGKSAI